MPNLRKNPFSTDFYRLFQSTDKTMIYGRICGFFLTRFGHYPPPHCTFEIAVFYGKKRFLDETTDFFVPSWANICPDFRIAVFRARAPSELFHLLPEISGFFGIPIGQPCVPMLEGCLELPSRFASANHVSLRRS